MQQLTRSPNWSACHYPAWGDGNFWCVSFSCKLSNTANMLRGRSRISNAVFVMPATQGRDLYDGWQNGCAGSAESRLRMRIR